MQILTSTEIPLVLGADGVIRVVNSRVSLDLIVQSFQSGSAAEEIVEQFPTLELADVYSIIGYYLHHTEEVDQYLRKRKKIVDQVRGENKKRFNSKEIRERLLARRKNS